MNRWLAGLIPPLMFVTGCVPQPAPMPGGASDPREAVTGAAEGCLRKDYVLVASLFLNGDRVLKQQPVLITDSCATVTDEWRSVAFTVIQMDSEAEAALVRTQGFNGAVDKGLPPVPLGTSLWSDEFKDEDEAGRIATWKLVKRGEKWFISSIQ